MKVLSLFDGISCGMVALERTGITVERYVAYEIEPNARIEVLKETAMRKDILIFPEIQAVFAYLCSAATDYHDAANVNSVKIISHFTGLTKYRVRKVIKALRDLGFVERTTCGFPAYEVYTENGLTDFDEARPPVNGFGLTKKGFESATYKKANELNEAEYKRWAEMPEEEILSGNCN